MKASKIVMRSFMDGFTGAGLFRKLDYPGAPTEFVDSRSLAEIKASGEFDRTVKVYEVAKQWHLVSEFLRDIAHEPHLLYRKGFVYAAQAPIRALLFRLRHRRTIHRSPETWEPLDDGVKSGFAELAREVEPHRVG